MQFSLRFDFRNPSMAETSMADRYAAALDMVEWGEPLGCVSVGVSEHHGWDDGYLPSPVVMLAAMSARTTTMRFSLSALLAPLYDPIRLAEDVCVLDNISKVRVELVIGAGYAREEFAMYGVGLEERPRRVREMVTTLRARPVAFAGFHPLCGGIPPDMAWESLHLFEHEVLPAFA